MNYTSKSGKSLSSNKFSLVNTLEQVLGDYFFMNMSQVPYIEYEKAANDPTNKLFQASLAAAKKTYHRLVESASEA